ncbi:MAG: serine/threonine protein kinase [Polyangiaceae bacterium]|nr:serine/threonine protein kinase [Polyangiaceae bacterium]MCW5791875.1 serine/threonine protein kinase [Polyangiaceae bacterium]
MLRALPWLFLLSLLTACGNHFTATTPPGFVEIEENYDRYDYRATNADGLVIAVREVDREGGDLAFWARAVENQLRDQAGYALLGKVDVKTKQGIAGKQLRFGLDHEGPPHLYYLTLFVVGDRAFIHEAGGTKELMTKHAADVTSSIEGLVLK